MQNKGLGQAPDLRANTPDDRVEIAARRKFKLNDPSVSGW
jgi:hypothetical protein